MRNLQMQQLYKKERRRANDAYDEWRELLQRRNSINNAKTTEENNVKTYYKKYDKRIKGKKGDKSRRKPNLFVELLEKRI